jgi:hypothetical protein
MMILPPLSDGQLLYAPAPLPFRGEARRRDSAFCAPRLATYAARGVLLMVCHCFLRFHAATSRWLLKRRHAGFRASPLFEDFIADIADTLTYFR